ncbi:DUF895 domain membrane protein [Metarhizium robertsii ARSEF 23]|uniref:DUF895 domain membrane protein n=2 Tax=Metarhizium robertsii TaxID=568076 RepID=E9EYZ0_METRA|nr:DUF895 domain membrane protein [Metarhizium robertsii ARSEF 23]EFY99181.2 DUF895 domain membrane protein [Metarhizium robertsii ARSEF 23]
MALPSRFSLYRPFTQNFLVGCILLCLPGIYTALTGLGAGGGQPSSADVANKTNALLYGLLALVALFGGTILNMLRPKLSLAIGSLGYPCYVGGLWYYDRTGNAWFALLAGAMLGITGGFLWTAAAYVQFSYAQEKDKGLYISTQWILRSIGAIVGSSISLGLSVGQTSPVGVSTPVYVAFIAIHTSAVLIALLLIVDPGRVVRRDGTHIAVFGEARLWPEVKGTLAVMLDRRYLFTAPAQLVCEMALALVSSVNSRYFNLRTRSVNNFAYQATQAFVPAVLVLVLDSKYIRSRRTRGLVGIAGMGTVAVGASAGLIGWLQVHRVDALRTPAGADWSDAEWPGLFVCYVLFGAVYAGYQMCVEYTLSATTNDPAVLARVAGMFKFYSAFGMMVSFVMAGEGVSFLGQITLQLVLYALGICGVVWVLVFHVQESNYFSEDNVIAPVAVEEQKRGLEAENSQPAKDVAAQNTSSVSGHRA